MISTITWVLPRPSKSKYKGSFPLHFEANLMQILGYPEKVLHPFGGMAEYGIRVDLNPETEPDFVGDAHNLDFLTSDFYDCTVLDPPYSDKEALDLYGTPPLRPATYTREAVRVTKPGGWVVIYTDKEPVRPAGCNPVLRILIVGRSNHKPRVCMIFQKRKPGMPHYGTEGSENSVSKKPPIEGQLEWDSAALPRGSKAIPELEYGREMGRDALERQRALAEEAAACTCNEGKRVSYHAPGCPKAKRRKT